MSCDTTTYIEHESARQIEGADVFLFAHFVQLLNIKHIVLRGAFLFQKLCIRTTTTAQPIV